jgi:polyhydroxyalkanoate synthesis regulator phasin
MKDGPKESDWKKFRAMVPDLRERYLEKKNKELAAIFQDEKLTPTEQFWEVEERVREESRILRDCLDGHSRSKMTLFILVMVRRGMLTNEDASIFSDELRERIRMMADF